MQPRPHRIAIVSTAPLWAGGVAAALAPEAGWRVRVQPGWDDADAAVLQVHGAADAARVHAALPTALPAVLLGEALRWPDARAGTGPARALALLPPDATAGQLRAAVAAVLHGLSVSEPPGAGTRAAATAHDIVLDDGHEPLTPRELEVFELVGKGLSNRDIGSVLGISPHTAKYHVGQILAKVGAATRAEAVSFGLKLGLIGL